RRAGLGPEPRTGSGVARRPRLPLDLPVRLPHRAGRARARPGRPAAGGRMSRSKDIGTRAETAVVRYLRANGFEHAERRALRGRQDAGDITGTPGICWEVKARKRPISDTDVA